jgi:hypothetical protein
MLASLIHRVEDVISVIAPSEEEEDDYQNIKDNERYVIYDERNDSAPNIGLGSDCGKSHGFWSVKTLSCENAYCISFQEKKSSKKSVVRGGFCWLPRVGCQSEHSHSVQQTRANLGSMWRERCNQTQGVC